MTKLGSTLLSSGAFSISSAQPELRINYDRTGGVQSDKRWITKRPRYVVSRTVSNAVQAG